MAGFFDNTLVPFKGKKIKKPKYLFEKFILKIRKKKPIYFTAPSSVWFSSLAKLVTVTEPWLR